MACKGIFEIGIFFYLYISNKERVSSKVIHSQYTKYNKHSIYMDGKCCICQKLSDVFKCTVFQLYNNIA